MEADDSRDVLLRRTGLVGGVRPCTHLVNLCRDTLHIQKVDPHEYPCEVYRDIGKVNKFMVVNKLAAAIRTLRIQGMG